jgi:t-SNARE complex subunit (syntaxin)
LYCIRLFIDMYSQITSQYDSKGLGVEEANVDVYESIEYQRKIRKKQCLIVLTVVIITVVLLFSIGLLP